MFRVQGVSPPPLLIYRLGIAILLLLLLNAYTSHRSQLNSIIETAKRDLEACRANSESIFSKLKVIYEHKKKVEIQYEMKINDTERTFAEMRKSFLSCNAELEKTQERISLLEKIMTTTSTAEKIKVSAEETSQLQRDEIQRLQKEVKEQKEELNRARKQLETIKREANECQRIVEQHVGALPVAHYTQNETAFFNRKHRVGEELAFDRDAIEHHRGEIVRGDILMHKLKEKRKQYKKTEDVHPDDRKEKDDYVNEQPDAAEQDYKEHHK